MNKQNGFTLIELVVVIIILGILAVTAAPKFINLQSDARASTLQGVKGAIQGANGLVFAKSALAGAEKRAKGYWTGDATDADDVKGGVDIGTDTKVKANFGYLQATQVELKNAMDADFDGDWLVVVNTVGTAVISQKDAPATTGSGNTLKGCSLTYVEATDASTIPTYTILSNGC